MELSRLQQILVRLYTDRWFRERFFNDPFGVGAAHGLSPIQVDRWRDLSGAQVEFFASSLVRKRMNEVRKMLPFSSQVLGRTFERLFWLYAETHTLEAHKPHQQDAVNFTNYLQQRVAKYVRPQWALNLARYEAAYIETIGLGHWWAVHVFRYPIDQLVATIDRKGEIIGPTPSPVLAIWHRFFRRRVSIIWVPLSLRTACADRLYALARGKRKRPDSIFGKQRAACSERV